MAQNVGKYSKNLWFHIQTMVNAICKCQVSKHSSPMEHVGCVTFPGRVLLSVVIDLARWSGVSLRYLVIWLVAACHLPVTKSTYMKPTDFVTQFWQLYMNIVVTYMNHTQKITWNLNIILLESKNIFQTSMFRFHISKLLRGMQKI